MVHVFKVTGPRKRRYIAALEHLTNETLREVCEPHMQRGVGYYVQDFAVFEADGNTKAFGIAWPYDQVEKDYCKLCGERAEFKRTSLVCTLCDTFVGGI
jgi:hypothetical protein